MLNEETPCYTCKCFVCDKEFFSDDKRRAVCPDCKTPHCAHCSAGLDRTAETGGKTFIHILTRGAGGQILRWQPCTRQQ